MYRVKTWEDIANLPEREERPFIEEMEEIMQLDIKNGIMEKNKKWLDDNSAYV